MTSPEPRRMVDDSSNLSPESQLHQGDTDEGEKTHSSTLGSASAAEPSVAPPLLRRIEPSPQDHLPVFHHLDEGSRIPKIDSLRHSQNEKVDIQSQGLYLVSSPAKGHVIADVVFVGANSDYGSHPYDDWLNKTAPGGSDYLPDDVKSYMPLARVWAYGYQLNFRKSDQLSSSANKFLVYYEEQRRRDRRNNPGMDDAAMPKLVFICAGLGGIVVKKILINCLQSGSTTQESFARSCQGIVFINTPHTADNSFLASTSSTILKDNPREAKTVIEDFLSGFAEMPSTFSIVDTRQTPHVPSPAHAATFPPEVRRKDRDISRVVTEKNPNWRNILDKDHQLLDGIMRYVLKVTDRSILLSIDGGGVRGLASLLMLKSLMQEIATMEQAIDPSLEDKHRIPADYFDLAGGTSTGGLICIMLFRLRMDIQSAIDEYRLLSPNIFRPSPTRYLGSNIFKTAFGRPWFKGKALEAVVKGIVQDRLSWEEQELMRTRITPLADARLVSPIEGTHDKSCRTFVCALKKEDNSAVRLRAYPNADRSEASFPDCKIWEAARATSAAPFYFPTAVVEDVKFWDGGLANNNPVLEVMAEGSKLFPLQLVNCVISLGTGFSERKPSKCTMPVLGKSKQILENVTNVNINHQRAKERCEENAIPYFRFTPSTADDDIGLADYKSLDVLTKHTEKYLRTEQAKMEIKQCAGLIHQHRVERQKEAVPVDATPQEDN